MNKRRTSSIWSIPKNELELVVATHKSYKEILATFGLENKGNNFKTLKQRMNEDCVEYSHLQKKGDNLRVFNTAKPLKEIMVINSNFSRGHLKKRLLKEGLLLNKCYECGLSDYWNNKPICLQLDHINGVSNDNRLENLRMLCPNCHSQTTTFAGRGLRLEKNKIKYGSDNVKFDMRSNHNPRLKRRKVKRPSKDVLEKLVWLTPTLQLAKTFGVSDKAISKWCIAYGISKPPRGYWSKQQMGM